MNIFDYAPEGATEIAFGRNFEIRWAKKDETYIPYKKNWIRRFYPWKTIATCPDIHGEIPELIDGDVVIGQEYEK